MAEYGACTPYVLKSFYSSQDYSTAYKFWRSDHKGHELGGASDCANCTLLTYLTPTGPFSETFFVMWLFVLAQMCLNLFRLNALVFRMLDRLNKDAVHLHEDMISQLRQMQDTVRYTFFECFLTLAGNNLLTCKC